ncbi:outer membrane beta-barrel protein [Methylocystis heyeri]|uniref:Outer membrane beta-barrel protein n=2 Tax=Methylocystis heyeri TaxID=391905 RepID=A0A6B8KJ67_9HYPH|nr:outer membrane beta-barrel protein [Methylocystis heyeri]
MAVKFRITILTIALAGGQAAAADLPSRKSMPEYVPPPPIWSGFYAGLNAGYGWGGTNGVPTAAFPLVDNIAADPWWRTPLGFAAIANSGVASVNQSGFVGGGQIGYNYQWSPSFVVGLEADLQGSAIRGAGGRAGIVRFGPDASGAFETAAGSGAVAAGVDWLGTVRGRVGYLVTPTLLAYATGGLAYGGVHANAAHALAFSDSLPTIYPTFGGTGSYSDTRVGWTVGGGGEWMFMPNWSLKAEALYYDLGSASFGSSPVGALDPDGTNLSTGVPGALMFANGLSTRVKYDGVLARAGVNYHFNWGAAAPAPESARPIVWSGFYAGLNAGYGWGGTNGVPTAGFPLVDNIAADPTWGTPRGFAAIANSGVASVNQSGFVGGGQIGYNYQWSPSFVIGLEADLQGSAIRGAGGRAGIVRFGPDASGAFETAAGSGAVAAGVDWLGTVRGRVGYLVTPTLLAYATGGLAYGGVHATAANMLSFSDSLPTIYPTFGGTGSYSDTRAGWTVGGGGEWMFTPNWSLKAEALYYDLGSASFGASPVGALDYNGTSLVNGAPGAVLFANSLTTRVKYDGVLARAGVNYHFDWGSAAPIVAKF